MAYDISTLIERVRFELADVPEEYLSDINIFYQLQKAKAFIDEHTSTTNEDYEKLCVIQLAVYFSYISYTSLAERQLGSIPATSEIRLQQLLEIALALINHISKYPINEKLQPDIKGKAHVLETTPTLIDDT